MNQRGQIWIAGRRFKNMEQDRAAMAQVRFLPIAYAGQYPLGTDGTGPADPRVIAEYDGAAGPGGIFGVNLEPMDDEDEAAILAAKFKYADYIAVMPEVWRDLVNARYIKDYPDRYAALWHEFSRRRYHRKALLVHQCYTTSDRTTDRWEADARERIALQRRKWPSRPIFVLLWQDYADPDWEARSRPLPLDYWRMMVRVVLDAGAQPVLWVHAYREPDWWTVRGSEWWKVFVETTGAAT